ncbi:MAG: OsmC family protein [Eubacteriales bacterium]|nr:OsmC family protein [Eubacteriales bacterium]
MKEKEFVKLEFGTDFDGVLTAENGTVRIGRKEGQLKPYNLLLGALLACLYATFLDIAVKMKLEYSGCELTAEAVKRETVPSTLEHVKIIMTIFDANEEQSERFKRATDLAAKYCSVYQTISHVSEMELEVEFK